MIYTAHELTKIEHAKKLRKQEQDQRKKIKEKKKRLKALEYNLSPPGV